MSALRFDGRTVIVTGGAGALGRAYALELAARGARVVVNDLGGLVTGGGGSSEAADAVVAEIVAAGGEAIADASDIASPEGAEAMVQAAVDRWGRVDALVANAGNIRFGTIEELTAGDLDAVLAVHVRGTFNCAKAAWPHMREQGFGRLIFTASSSGLLGAPGFEAYGAAKGGVVGLMHCLAEEGRPLGITCNALMPNAASRMAAVSGPGAIGENPWAREFPRTFDPRFMAGLVAWLAHADCTTTHEIYTALGGRIGRMFVGVTAGWNGPIDTPPTAEDIAANFDRIRDDEAGYAIPANILDEFRIVSEGRAQ